MWEGDFLTVSDMDIIANTLAWCGDSALEERIYNDYGLDFEVLEKIMARDEYEWDFSTETWISTRELWADWDGKLPSRAE